MPEEVERLIAGRIQPKADKNYGISKLLLEQKVVFEFSKTGRPH